jgi:hypothetical protein
MTSPVAEKLAAKYPLAGTLTLGGNKYRLREPADGDVERLVSALRSGDLFLMRAALRAQFDGDAPDLSKTQPGMTAHVIVGLLDYWKSACALRLGEIGRVVKGMGQRLEDLAETAGGKGIAAVLPAEGDRSNGSAGGGAAGAAERGFGTSGTVTAFVSPESLLVHCHAMVLG